MKNTNVALMMKNTNVALATVYISGQFIFRSILLSRQMYSYDWTRINELVLIVCMGLFMLQHYGSIVLLKTKKKFQSKSNRVLLGWELALGALWLLYILFFLLIGVSFSKMLLLEVAFNLIPIICRLIAVGVDRK